MVDRAPFPPELKDRERPPRVDPATIARVRQERAAAAERAIIELAQTQRELARTQRLILDELRAIRRALEGPR